MDMLTDAELIKGKNGKPLFNEWSKLPEEVEDCSRQEIKLSHRLDRGF